ncbi:MAG: hypothetical protein R2865_04430 [Deinococcales bacterium]
MDRSYPSYPWLLRLMGQAGSSVIADILFGRSEPIPGKLAETFPKASEQPRLSSASPVKRAGCAMVRGFFISYRYYDAKGIDTSAFPLGMGLSYTSFSYSNLKVSQQSFKYNEGFTGERGHQQHRWWR